MARPTVKNTWIWMTSDARPGEIKRVIAMNSSPNCPTPISRPYAARLRQRALGRRISHSAGRAASAKRSVARSSGGRWFNAILMTGKLLPHTATTATASSRWRAGSAPLCAAGATGAGGRGAVDDAADMADAGASAGAVAAVFMGGHCRLYTVRAPGAALSWCAARGEGRGWRCVGSRPARRTDAVGQRAALGERCGVGAANYLGKIGLWSRCSKRWKLSIWK